MFLFSEWRYLNEALIEIVFHDEARRRVSLSKRHFLKTGGGVGEVIVIKRAGVRFYCMYLMIGPGWVLAGAGGNNKPLISISVCTEKIRGCHPRTVRPCVRAI